MNGSGGSTESARPAANAAAGRSRRERDRESGRLMTGGVATWLRGERDPESGRLMAGVVARRSWGGREFGRSVGVGARALRGVRCP